MWNENVRGQVINLSDSLWNGDSSQDLFEGICLKLNILTFTEKAIQVCKRGPAADQRVKLTSLTEPLAISLTINREIFIKKR